jgi:hypothetical protein
MATSVHYTEVAAAEISEAAHACGVEFLDELLRIEGHLRAHPTFYHRCEVDIRRAVLRRFPYGLFYVIDGDAVTVLACFHLHRHPQSRRELQEGAPARGLG